ncbi:E3 ubiquitin-protein ligase MARCHF3 isoform X2 [Leptinotarsa decemlineata]|uniref:E3 ubiquitin-protein ligase MARCHF3 isoform X2 n=1 Tax=Leptinotarsa decemlineata TaxID=7539 RepID=UPI000C252D8D|nr:E3 ubiquitin-protein ligase MARCH3-like isoform X2 [Leptinotarsa decemlineata]
MTKDLSPSQGTVAFVHRSCLETWLGESNSTTCELCHTIFKTERTPRFTSSRSIWYWCRHPPTGAAQGVRNDILACGIITPLAIVITYVCLFSSEYYNQQKFSNVPAARWTSVSLLVMIGIMLIGYYMWVYSVIRMHARMWYNWWQRTCDVRYIPHSRTRMDTLQNLNNHNQPDFSSIINLAEGSDYTVSSTAVNVNLDVHSVENEVEAVQQNNSTVTTENYTILLLSGDNAMNRPKSEVKLHKIQETIV